jgi:hypothetical protein
VLHGIPEEALLEQGAGTHQTVNFIFSIKNSKKKLSF